MRSFGQCEGYFLAIFSVNRVSKFCTLANRSGRMIFRLFIFFFFLHLVTGVEIKSVQTYHRELNVNVGQQLLIPCYFQLDEPIGENKIKLQWSVKLPEEDEFHPIYQLEDTTLLTAKEVNIRARMNLQHVHQGDCSLVIDPVHGDDGGIYNLQLAINGDEFPGDTRVNVYIIENSVKIKNIQTYHRELNVTVGNRLVIPCHFKVDKPLRENQVLLKWNVRPFGEDKFHPIVMVYDTKLLPIKHPIRTAWIKVSQLRQGLCSLVIPQVHLHDSGTYEVHLAINGDEFPGHTRVNVYVKENDKTDPNQPMNNEESQSRKANKNEDLDLMRTAEVIQGLKDNGVLLALGICGGVLLLVMLLSIVATIYFGCRYCRLKHKAADDIKQMEEGRQCELPVPTPHVSITMENPQDVSLPMEYYVNEYHPTVNNPNVYFPMEYSPDVYLPMEDYADESTPIENWHEESSPMENGHEESSPMENGHEESSLMQNGHEESSLMQNRHEESTPMENRHNNSTPMDNPHNEPIPIPPSSQEVDEADPPPVRTAEERQRVLKRVRSRVRGYLRSEKYLKGFQGGRRTRRAL